MRPRIDSRLEEDVNRLMCCAPMDCPREISCLRVARFARDKLREMHAANTALGDDDLENIPALLTRYGVIQPSTGSWETP